MLSRNVIVTAGIRVRKRIEKEAGEKKKEKWI